MDDNIKALIKHCRQNTEDVNDYISGDFTCIRFDDTFEDLLRNVESDLANVAKTSSDCVLTVVRERALKWWNELNYYKRCKLAEDYYTQDALSIRHEQDKIDYVYCAEHTK